MKTIPVKVLKTILPQVIELCHQTSQIILAIYNKTSPPKYHTKSDLSPVTEADIKADRMICEQLEKIMLFEGQSFPVLSEENDAPVYAIRKQWENYWLVDPLDGTKEFLAKTDEFTINIALIQEHEPVLGVVYVPCKQIVYYAIKNTGAFKQKIGSIPHAIHTKPYNMTEPLHVLVSRRHSRSELDTFFLPNFTYNITNIGSSLKMCWIAEGKADCYPRLGPTSEWDTAAAHCVLREAGGEIRDLHDSALCYNKKSSLLNPPFLAIGDLIFDWQAQLI